MGIFYRDFAYLGISAPVPGGTIFITEIVIAFFIVAGFLKLSILKSLRKWIVFNQKVILYYFLFLLSSVSVLFYSNWSNIGLTLREFASSYYSFFFFLPIFLFKYEEQQDLLFRVILIASLFAQLLIIYRAVMGLGIINSTGELRFGNYETIGIIILISWLFIIPFYEWKLSYWFIFVSSVVITFVFINHRSALIALITSIFTVNYLNNRKNLLTILKNLLIGFLILFVILLPLLFFYKDMFSSALERFITIFLPTEDANSSWRLYTWKIILSDMNVFNWLIGKGWGWQIPVFEFNNRVYGAEGEIFGFHNSVLFFLYHLGVFGLGTFCLFVIKIYTNSIKLIKNYPKQLQLKVNSLIAANIGILTFSLFNVVLEGPYMSFFFWITLGMIYHYPHLYAYNQGIILETCKK